MKELNFNHEREFNSKRVTTGVLATILNDGEEEAREQFGDDAVDRCLRRHHLAWDS